MSMIAHTENMDFSKIDIPAMFYFSDKDKVVNAEITREVIQQWCGVVHMVNPTLENVLTDGYHVIAGDIVSPSQTAPATAAMLDWIKTLSIR